MTEKIKQFKQELINEIFDKYKGQDVSIDITVEDVISEAFKVVNHYNFGIGSEIQDGLMEITISKDGMVKIFCEDHMENNKFVEDEYEDVNSEGRLTTDLHDFGIQLLIYILEKE